MGGLSVYVTYRAERLAITPLALLLALLLAATGAHEWRVLLVVVIALANAIDVAARSASR